MSAEEFHTYDSMKLFMHQIYEYRKGVRQLVLCTMCPECCDIMRQRLASQGIAYIEQRVTDHKVNLYFGSDVCLRVVETFVHKQLWQLSAAEDFMLGAMLGYDIRQQCERYCKRSSAEA